MSRCHQPTTTTTTTKFHKLSGLCECVCLTASISLPFRATPHKHRHQSRTNHYSFRLNCFFFFFFSFSMWSGEGARAHSFFRPKILHAVQIQARSIFMIEFSAFGIKFLSMNCVRSLNTTQVFLLLLPFGRIFSIFLGWIEKQQPIRTHTRKYLPTFLFTHRILVEISTFSVRYFTRFAWQIQ